MIESEQGDRESQRNVTDSFPTKVGFFNAAAGKPNFPEPGPAKNLQLAPTTLLMYETGAQSTFNDSFATENIRKHC